MAGALHAMAQQGTEVTLAVMTPGDVGRTTGTDEEVAEATALTVQRQAEVEQSAAELGIDEVVQFTFPNGRLEQTDQAQLAGAIAALIDQTQPSAVITFDTTFGYLGNADHRALGAAVLQVVNQGAASQADYPVAQVWVPTLSPRVIEIAKDQSATFRRDYPADGPGLPQATVAVDIFTSAQAKAAAARAHVTHSTDLDHTLPGFGMVPDAAYFRVLDVEYFASVWEAPAASTLP
jgi:LmbE family N-acetylglucosaminyl deacetylase